MLKWGFHVEMTLLPQCFCESKEPDVKVRPGGRSVRAAELWAASEPRGECAFVPLGALHFSTLHMLKVLVVRQGLWFTAQAGLELPAC